ARSHRISSPHSRSGSLSGSHSCAVVSLVTESASDPDSAAVVGDPVVTGPEWFGGGGPNPSSSGQPASSSAGKRMHTPTCSGLGMRAERRESALYLRNGFA